MSDSGEHRAAQAIARAWNELETGSLASLLDERVRYSSTGVDMVLEGRREVLAYLDRKMQLIELAGEEARIEARVARVEQAAGGRWAVLSSQGPLDRAALFMPSVDDAGGILEIEVLTDADLLRSAVICEAPS